MFRNIVVLTILSYFVLIPSKAFSSEPSYVAGEVLVRFASKTDGKYLQSEEADAIAASVCGGKVKNISKFLPGLMLVKLPDDLSVEDAVLQFRNTPGVMRVQPNYIYRVLSAFPNDPCFPYLWGLHNTGQTGGMPDADIDAPEAWDLHTGSSNIIVAVIDSGVDYTHPDLAANMWVDANGCYGYDFYNDDNNPMDDYGHGTHCAGIIGAVGNNSQGVTGVCWNVKIMALKAADSYGYVYTWSARESIYYAIAKGAKVLSNSWGGYNNYDQYLKDAIDTANEAGVLFVAAVGNDGRPTDIYTVYPAGYDCNNIIL